MRRAAAAGIVAVTVGTGAGCGDEVAVPSTTPRVDTAQRTAPAPPPPDRRPGTARRVPGTGTLTAHVTRNSVLRARPGGRRLARMRRVTEFDSPRVVTVVGRRGPWLGVLAPELRNGRVGWIDGRRGVRLYRVNWSVDADLSRRLVVVRRGARVVVRTRVAIGRPGAPTPRGRFAVTDKLLTGNPQGPYGCCVLALTGHQPNTPQGWGGGDRLAIHATPAEHTIGHAASLGCLRAPSAVMRRLVRQVPLGTQVRIRA
jgi:L,D-transpeptidase catalytic domain